MPDGGHARVGLVLPWLAVRLEPWRPVNPALGGGTSPILPDTLLGVVCLMFAVGPGAMQWSQQLGHSGWYALMRPRVADLAGRGPASGVSAGSAAMYPGALFATVAVMDGASVTDVAGLVRELKGRTGRARLRVVVTVGEAMAAPTVLALRHEVDVVVIRAAAGMAPDHLHHFPVRAAFSPATGRLVCTDLADCMLCWMAGRVAELHLIPFNAGAAQRDLVRLAERPRPAAAMLIVHFPPTGPDSTLQATDALADVCRDALFGADDEASLMFTNGDRLDGRTGTADLLLVG